MYCIYIELLSKGLHNFASHSLIHTHKAASYRDHWEQLEGACKDTLTYGQEATWDQIAYPAISEWPVLPAALLGLAT